MTVYAVTYQKDVPDYITRGKRYRATEDVTGLGFNTVSDSGSAIYCGWAGSSHLDGGSWTRIEEEDDMQERITLQKGDYVSTKGLTEDDYHAVARAFMAAGADPDEYPDGIVDLWDYFGWHQRRGGLEFWDDPETFGASVRHLTPQQVVSATNAKRSSIQLQEGDYFELDKLSDDQYHEVCQAMMAAGCGKGEYPFEGGGRVHPYLQWWHNGSKIVHGGLECKRLLTYEDVFPSKQEENQDMLTTILEQAAEHEATAKHHAAMHERLMQQAREMLPEGWRLVRAEDMAEAVSVDAGEWMKGTVEDMSDPANWREGDVVEVVTKDEKGNVAQYGGAYEVGELCGIEDPGGDLPGWDIFSKEHKESFYFREPECRHYLKWHHRP